MSRRVLIIAYYFPPFGLSGVQRIAKFAKYLPENEWDVTVLTVQPGSYFAFDSSLLQEVEQSGTDIIRTYSLDPTRLPLRRRVSLPKEGSRHRLSMLSQTLFQPDNKIGWLPFAVRQGRRILRETEHHAIISSAPPYTGHLVGAMLARKSRLPLMLDYRDDWLDNPRHYYPSAWHRSVAERMEQRVFRQAYQTISINKEIAYRLRKRSRGLMDEDRHTVLPHGFDPADFSGRIRRNDDNRMHFAYTGVFYDAQKPDVFLRGLARFLAVSPANRSRIVASFYGLMPESSLRLVEELGISEQVDYRGYVSHPEAVNAMRSADVLWMTIGRRAGSTGISTGKLYEYFGARKPILALVPNGVARDSLTRYNAGEIAAPDDPDEVAFAIGKLFMQWDAGTLPVPDESVVLEHDRRALTARLAEVLNNSTM